MSNKDHVKQTAIKMVEEAGLINLSRRELCTRAGIPDGSFPHVMGCTFGEFVEELVAEGVNPGSVESVSRNRVNPELRREQILSVAVDLSKTDGYHKITREQIAAKCGISPSLIRRYFGTMPKLRRDIMRAAVRGEVVEIIAQGLAVSDDHAKKAPNNLKQAAAAYLIA